MSTAPEASNLQAADGREDLSAVAWVVGELQRSLDAAHKALRRFLKEAQAAAVSDVDAPDSAILRQARVQFHQSLGALELVGLPQPAKVLRASEAAVQRVASKPALLDAAAVDAIEGASFAVIDFLNRLLSGRPMPAVALFPQYRAVQMLAGVDRIHPADLWDAHWRWQPLAAEAGVRPRVADDASRGEMEALVLSAMRGGEAAARPVVSQLSDFCASLAAGASSSPTRTSWQLAAAFFEAQAQGLLDNDVYAKRMGSRLLSQLRASVRTGEEVSELLASDLLFFCARARLPQTGQAPRLHAVRQAWELGDTSALTDYETARLGRFDPAWLTQARKRVVAAKDVWSAVAGGDSRRLATLAEPFSLLGDSLQRLFPGGDVLAKALQAAAGQTMASGAAPGNGLAMEMATAVLWIDAALEEGALDKPELVDRVRHVASRIDLAREGGDVQPLEPWIEELYRRVSDQQTMGSVVQELRASLTEVEKAIDQFFRNPTQRDALVAVPGQLQAMRGVLSVLDMAQASAAVVHMRNQVDELASTEIDPQMALQAGTFDRLADNLGTLGFLIDMISVQPTLARSLFHFDAVQGRLMADTGGAAQPSGFGGLGPPSAVMVGPPAADSRPATLDSSWVLEPTIAVAPPAPAMAPAPPAAPAVTGLEDDDEMRGIFLEEAREVVATARAALQALNANSEDVGEMTTVRRAFHTLKGSSRMVGLREFGEAAWGCEQLYNARLASDPRVDLGLADFSRRAVDELANWIEDIEQRQDGQRSARALMAQADALRLGRAVEPSTPDASVAQPVAMPVSGEHESVQPSLTDALPELPDLPAFPDAVPARDDDLESMTVFEALLDDHLEPEAVQPIDSIEASVEGPRETSTEEQRAPLTDHATGDTAAEVDALPSIEPTGPAEDDTFVVEATQVLDAPFEEPTMILPRHTGRQALTDIVPDLPSAADLELGLTLGSFDDLSRSGRGETTDAAGTPRSHDDVPPTLRVEMQQEVPEVVEIIHADAAGELEPPPSLPLPPAPVSTPDAPGELSDLTLDLEALDGDSGLSETDEAPESRFERTQIFSEPIAETAPDARHDLPADPAFPSLALDDDGARLTLDLGDDEGPELPTEATLVLEPGSTQGDGVVDDIASDDTVMSALPMLGLDLPAEAPAVAPSDGSGPDGLSEAVAEAPTADADAAADADEGVKVIGPLRISIPLFNIFLNEADEQSRRLVTQLAEWSLEWHTTQAPEAAESLAHSLAGNSATVGYLDLSTLSRALEHAIERSRLNSRGRAGESELFADTADEIRRLLHQFAAGFLKPVPAALLARLLDHENWPPQDMPAMGDDIAARADESVEVMADLAVADLAPDPAFEAQVDSVTPTPEPADEIDAELLPIFMEEAEELLPQLQERIGEWMARPDNRSAADGAMRNLHTFKGGARLAGAFRVGELAHQLESEIEHLLSAESLQSDALEPLQGQVDEIVAAFDALRPPRSTGDAQASQFARLVTEHVPLPAAAPASAPTEDQARPALDASAAEIALGQPHTEFDAGTPSPEAFEVDASTDGPDANLMSVAGAAAAVAALSLGQDGTQPDAAAAEDVPGLEDGDEAAASVGADLAAEADIPLTALTVVPIDWGRFAGAQVRAAGSVASNVAQPAPVAAGGVVRVRSGLLDRLVNSSGEVSIARARIETDVHHLQGSLGELTGSLERMRRELRDIEVQAESQISARIEAAKASAQAFDPLEMDRFTRLQELTRMMAESVNDVATVQRSLLRTLQSTEDQLAAQARLTRELQDDLLRTRMTEFESLADRLYRVVRQASRDANKQVKLDIVGGAIEVDRGVLERMAGPFEHLLRNSVAHGIEGADERVAAGKDRSGTIRITVTQAGNEVIVEIADDGAGLNLPRIRERAIERGLLGADGAASDDELARLIFLPGFSTATAVTELAGRGVGMDVVRSEINAMGGRIETHTQRGQGTQFRLVLPLTTAVTQVVMLRCGLMRLAVPSTLVEVVRRVPSAEVAEAYTHGHLQHAGESVTFFWLAALVDGDPPAALAGRTQAVVIVRSASQRVALHVDEVEGNQEVVVKNLGPQLARMPGLAGVTLLPSGDVALIYNPVALAALHGDKVRARQQADVLQASTVEADGGAASGTPSAVDDLPPLVMVVDDSLTVRRITQRLLEREGYRVVLAKDGIDALEKLDAERPRVMLCDIEMPRMDGFELVRTMRADPQRQGIPVVMITSRIAQKHRDHAATLGVQHYLGKPFPEETLLELVAQYCAASASSVAA